MLIPCAGVLGGGTLIEQGQALAADTLHLLQSWLAEERFAGTRLAVARPAWQVN
ncbi:hypothetical protein AB0B25_15565 [Nocardia sp. NPDC049190]|uniref:hypothetical protein n=1 Tax=Nocardia sp. NPDC049190 TaxID=3155650 RepID=UPI0034109375